MLLFLKILPRNISDLFITGIPEEIDRQVPDAFTLMQNYPNPFNPKTIIRYQLPVLSEVKLTIYDLLGREIDTIVNERQPVGEHTVHWDGRDDLGKTVSSGVFIYRLQAGTFVENRKMLLLR